METDVKQETTDVKQQADTNTRGILTLSPESYNSAIKSSESNEKEKKQEHHKTDMCLMNELSRYNQVKHVYTLIDEHGPAHQKTFIVKLTVGDEQYTGTGHSIKKAQHAAAAEGLRLTNLKHPPERPAKQKTPRFNNPNENRPVTATVELNALLMKRGEVAEYQPTPARPPVNPPPPQPADPYAMMFNPRLIAPQRMLYPYRQPHRMAVKLVIGEREFYGEGNSKQAAKHHAAAKALKILKSLKIPEKNDPKPSTNGTASPSKASPESVLAGKSAVSVLYEMAIRKNVPLSYEELREVGPPHARVYTMKCTCGEHSSEADGMSKRVAKKLASEQLLKKLVEETKLFEADTTPTAGGNKKRRTRNNTSLVKEAKADVNYGVGVNPVSRLCQIQQSKKQVEPQYELIAERGLPRRNKEFTIQVVVGNVVATGTGPNKKLAKRHAAEAMLAALGYIRRGPTPAKPAIKADGSGSSDKRVTFSDSEIMLGPNQASSRPAGVLYGEVPGSQRPTQRTATHNAADNTPQRLREEAQTLARKVLADEPPAAGGDAPTPSSHKEKLLHVANTCGFKVQFTEFPRNSSQQYLCLASLLLDTPQVFHGTAGSVAQSQDAAALAALQALAKSPEPITKDSKSAEIKVEGSNDTW